MKSHAYDLIQSIKMDEKVYIQPHNMPDPDAIASSFALSELFKIFKIESEIIYMNEIEKVNSKKMIEIFEINMEVIDHNFIIEKNDHIILVDSQLGNANISNLKGKNVSVIDHHADKENEHYIFKDIREQVGACSTIITEYFRELEIEPSVDVATVLLYGIMNDTNNLTTNTYQEDIDNFYFLYGLANSAKIKKLHMSEIGRGDLKAYAKALETFEVYGNIGFVHIENCNDSLLGTISDMVNTIEGTYIVVSYAKRADGIKFSVRSSEKDIYADELVKYIIKDKGVGGGHKGMAGGFIPEEKMSFLRNKELDTYVRYKTIHFVENKIKERKKS